jgi:hypothetical protein
MKIGLDEDIFAPEMHKVPVADQPRLHELDLINLSSHEPPSVPAFSFLLVSN